MPILALCAAWDTLMFSTTRNCSCTRVGQVTLQGLTEEAVGGRAVVMPAARQRKIVAGAPDNQPRALWDAACHCRLMLIPTATAV